MDKQIIKNTFILKKTVLFIILAVFFVALDRFLKILCLKGFFDQPLYLIDDIFSLHYAKNYGIAFSLPFSGPILTIVIALIIIILLFYWVKLLIQNSKFKIQNSNLYPLTLLILGAITNLLDRIKYGHVIDYFDLKWFTVFNLADCLISISIILMIFLFKKSRGAQLNFRITK